MAEAMGASATTSSGAAANASGPSIAHPNIDLRDATLLEPNFLDGSKETDSAGQIENHSLQSKVP